MLRSEEVVQQLLDEMDRIVAAYHASVGRTGHSVDELIAGTAMFPGGAGLWRGAEPFGALPEQEAWWRGAVVLLAGSARLS